MGIFGYRLRPGADTDEYMALAFRMLEVLSENPEFGFRSCTPYTAANGDGLLYVEFESLEGIVAWRNHPEHLAAQERGRIEFLESYWVDYVNRQCTFDLERGRQTVPGRDAS